MNRQINVAVLMGGMSSEHEVSLHSGAGVLRALESGPYRAIPVTITRKGDWLFPDTLPMDIYQAIPMLKTLDLGCVFIALHGPYGEDGRIQSLLDLLGLPYTGSGCAASALAMDKVRCKAVVAAAGVRVARHLAFSAARWSREPEVITREVKEQIGYPCVIKPVCQGSSVGITIPRNTTAFLAGAPRALDADPDVLVEEFIEGVELTCAVLDAEPEGGVRALPVTEIRPRTAAFFDYTAKYTPGASEEITPARIDPGIAAEVQRASECVHRAVGCAGWSRSDFILGGKGPVWIEVNTVPGLTQTSLYPQAAAAAGISYAEMIGLFIEAARRNAEKRKERVNA